MCDAVTVLIYVQRHFNKQKLPFRLVYFQARANCKLKSQKLCILQVSDCV